MYAWEILGFWKVGFSLYWLLLIHLLFFTNYLYLISYYKYLGDRAHCSSENWLLLECFFFKTMRMYWLLLYFTKLLYLVGVKYNLFKACYSRVQPLRPSDDPAQQREWAASWWLHWLLEFVFTHDCVKMYNLK